MGTIALTDLETLAVGLAALVVAGWLHKLPVFSRIDVPVPVIGGVLMAVLASVLHRFNGTTFEFAGTLMNFFLLVFFTTVGLSAKLSALKSGGRPLVILCLVTVVLLVLQNVVGLLVARAAGANPFYGLLIGSVSFVGGPGTAAAWAKEAQAAGLANAPEVAVGAATLAVIVGAIVSGPITAWLVRRHHLHGPSGPTPANWVAPDRGAPAPAPPVSTILRVLLLIIIAVLVGDAANEWARGAGVVLPGFLTAMLAGALITNVADVIGARIAFAPVERGGEIALQCFLVMYLMGLKLWTLGPAIVPLLANLVAQLVLATLVGVLLLFRWLGKDYDAALTVGGFLGFGLSSMPVAMATMDSVAARHGPSPKAFLLIALAGSFFVDFANAFIVKAFLLLPGLN
ncbi:sodium/glutamate symporter [Lysobacter helvus]|uniref:Sodium/glutamate symporter n=3 Tax=Lysobacterales TaxID=135614 RepID=A0ABM7Q7G3_9GAMM|nr:sodium/glutamate symporter [Lysobacter caseinilyticus]BCT96370.1 sodium/glutamate symporter [Lysobacter helvus]